MELDLIYKDALPVGDKGSGYCPPVVALSLHQKPQNFGDDIRNVLAVATAQDVRIYHQKQSWEEVLKVEWNHGEHWRSEDLAPVKCLAWDPVACDLAAGDQNGSITLFILRKVVRNNRYYHYQSRFHDENCEDVCSISWSVKGEYMAAALKKYMAIIKKLPSFQVVQMFPLPYGDHTVKFHPFLPYIFLGSRRHGDVQVFSNLTPQMQEAEWKRLLTVPGGNGCIGMSLFSRNKFAITVIATSGNPSSIWNFRLQKSKPTGGIRQLELDHVGTLKEDKRSRGQLISVAFLSKEYLLGGYKNGSIVIYKGKNERTAFGGKYMYYWGRSKWPDHRFVTPIPSVPCMIRFHTRGLEAIVGGNYGFVHFKELTTKKNGRPLLEQDVEWELQYYDEPPTPMTEEVDTMNDGRLSSLSQQAAEHHEDSATAAGEARESKAGKSEALPSSSLAAGVKKIVSEESADDQLFEIIFDELKTLRKHIGLGVEQWTTSAVPVQQQATKSHRLSTLCDELQAVRRHIEKNQVVSSQLPEASVLVPSAPDVAVIPASADSADRKSSFVLDMKPRGGSTPQEQELAIRSIQMEGLLWGKSTLITDEHGTQKMQITMTIDDIVFVKRLIENCLHSCDVLNIKKRKLFSVHGPTSSPSLK